MRHLLSDQQTHCTTSADEVIRSIERFLQLQAERGETDWATLFREFEASYAALASLPVLHADPIARAHLERMCRAVQLEDYALEVALLAERVA